MSKTLNELASMLKELIKDLNSDAHNANGFKAEHYNNLKVSMSPDKDTRPHVIVTIGMSEAMYSLSTHQRISGSLGPDEKYVLRWFNKTGVADSLKDLWRTKLRKQKEIDEKERERRKKLPF